MTVTEGKACDLGTWDDAGEGWEVGEEEELENEVEKWNCPGHQGSCKTAYIV